MGRKSHRQQLNVWMNGLCVGKWSLTRSGEAFTYHDSWLNHPQARPLSLSLPFLPGNAAYRGSVVNAYFDRIQPRHWLAQARSCGLTEAWANDLLNELIQTPGPTLFYADQLALGEELMRRHNLRFKKIPRDITRL